MELSSTTLSFHLNEKKIPIGLKLKHLLLFFRHGDRSPICSNVGSNLLIDETDKNIWAEKLPTDNEILFNYKYVADVVGPTVKDPPPCEPVDSNQWPLGQLTKKGCVQLQEIGNLYRRNIYKTYLNNILPHEVYIRSTNINRTIQSVQNFVKGAFPEHIQSTSDAFKVNFHIHTENPIILAPSHSKKDYLNQLNVLRNANDSPIDVTRLESQIRYIIGIDNKQNIHWDEVREVLVCRKEHLMGLPTGITEEILQDIFLYNAWEWKKIYSNKEICYKCFHIGVNEVFQMLQMAVQEKIQHKISLFSAHDSSIAALVNALKFDIGLIIPPYGSCLAFEIYQDETNNEYYIQICFQNKELKFPSNYKINEKYQGYFYSFSTFKKIVQEFLRQDNLLKEDIVELMLPGGTSSL